MSALELIDQAIAKLDQLLSGAPAPSTPQPAAPVPAAAPKLEAAPAPDAAASPAPTKPAKAAAPAAKPAAQPTASTSGSSIADLFDKVLIKVARISTIEPLANSEKLYKLQVDVGNGETRQVCAGLRQFLPESALAGALVCVVLNLKPAKLAGQLSEAMILAGETQLPDGGPLMVRTLVPPAGSEPGDQVYLEGRQPSQATAKQLKSDDWKKVGAVLAVWGGVACCDKVPLVTGKGGITLPAEIVEGSSIH